MANVLSQNAVDLLSMIDASVELSGDQFDSLLHQFVEIIGSGALDSELNDLIKVLKERELHGWAMTLELRKDQLCN